MFSRTNRSESESIRSQSRFCEAGSESIRSRNRFCEAGVGVGVGLSWVDSSALRSAQHIIFITSNILQESAFTQYVVQQSSPLCVLPPSRCFHSLLRAVTVAFINDRGCDERPQMVSWRASWPFAGRVSPRGSARDLLLPRPSGRTATTKGPDVASFVLP